MEMRSPRPSARPSARVRQSSARRFTIDTLMIPYVLVSLKASTDRRQAFFSKNLVNIGDPVLTVGVDGRLLPAQEYFRLGVLDHATPLSPAEVGCALSHVQAYEYLEQSGQRAVFVFEDDVEPSSNVDAGHLKILLNTVEDNEIILLGGLDGLTAQYDIMGYPDSRFPGLSKIPEPMMRWAWRACCYVVGRHAAKAIRGQQLVHLAKADDWRRLRRCCGVSFAYVPIFRHPVDMTRSLIETGRSGEPVFSPGTRQIRQMAKRLYLGAYRLTHGMEPMHRRPTTRP